ncbi:MAG TPA: phage baseplate assembly protein V [Polyangia bacterium]|nr:phage baseplate assembly protein V [Polyangia bacterium]
MLRSQNVVGVMIGIVTNIVHDAGDYRVKVRFPTLPNGGQDGEESHWCRIVSYMAGKDRGVFWLPEVEDEVLVCFVNGDFNQGVILGAFWNGTDKPIYSNKDASGKVTDLKLQGKNEAKKNDLRVLRSRVGHQLVFNDNASEPRVALHSQQKHRIVLDDKDNAPTQIEIYDGKEENYILIDTKNKKITIESKSGDMLLKCKEKFTVEAKNIEMKSDENTKITVGKNFEMKASSNMTIKASGTGDIESSDAMTLKGSKVNIN